MRKYFMKDKSKNKTSFGFKEVDSDKKADLVGSVFDTVSKNYDLMNDLMSFGIHRLWKKVTIETSGIKDHFVVLDLASGTGDMVKLMRDKISEKGTLILSDINASMLNEGRNRLIDEGIEDVHPAQIDAQFLPFKDNTFDAIFVGFGIRNFTNIKVGLKEMRRCLKDNGNLIILEFSNPQSGIFQNIYDWYSFRILPKIGKLVANDENSYKYLVESIRMHPNQEKLKSMIIDSGYNKCKFFNLLNGVVAIHKAVK